MTYMYLVKSKEYSIINHDDYTPKGCIADHILADVVKKNGGSNPEKQKKILGLHLHENKPKLHWFVGLVWLDLDKNIALQVTPKIENISAFRMYLKCLSDPIVSSNLDETIDFWADEPFIKVDNKEIDMEINPLIITRYLQLLKDLCKRHLRHSYKKRDENLTGRIRGRPNIPAHISSNVSCGRLDRMFCNFSYNTLDNTFNQILKAALEQCLKWLRNCPYDNMQTLWDMAAYCASSLNSVSIRPISTLDFKGIRYSGFLKPYREPHKWARLVLECFGYDPLKEMLNIKDTVLPPFAIDMNMLFERYCEVYLRKYNNIWVGYKNLSGKFSVCPDYLVYDGYKKWIIDAKYKVNWPNKEHREDIYQVLAYSRHQKVLKMLDELQSTYKTHDTYETGEQLKILIMYPCSDSCLDWENFNLDLETCTDLEYELTIKIGHIKIPLPARNV